MRNMITAVCLVGAMSVLGFAATVDAVQATAKKPASTKAPASHATTGTVKSMTSDTLVITRPGKRGGDVTFTLNSSTTKEGNPDVGAKVSVRYREEGKNKVATAVMVQSPAKGKK